MTKPRAIRPLGEADEYIRMMLVAAPGFGKTVFFGTAEKGLFLTTDPEGTLSAKRMGSQCDEWKIGHSNDLSESYLYLKNEGHKEYDWVFLDNVTEAQSLHMAASMENARKRNASRDEFVPGLDDHQRSQLQTVDMIKKFNDLPMNVGYTAHTTIRDDAEGNPIVTAAIHGKDGAIANQIMGYMNILGFGEVVEKGDEEIRRIYFTHHNGFIGKDRYQVLGKARDGLTIPRLERLVAAPAKPAATKAPAKRPATRRPAATTKTRSAR